MSYENYKIKILDPHMSGKEMQYISNAFRSNWITTSGDNIDEFETSLENYLGENSFVTALNSGTSAIHLALKLLGVGNGDEVICQTFTFCATAFPILYAGAKPVFVDSENDTWNISPVYLRKAIKDRLKNHVKPKAIIVVDSYGMPAKWDEILEISKEYDIPIIEDAAEALGSKYKDRHCGTFGTHSVFSFNGNKILTTSSGGALVSKDMSFKRKTIFYAQQSKENQNYYLHNEVGYNYRMSNVLAGIGLGQLEVLNDRILKKRDIHRIYTQKLLLNKNIRFLKESNDWFYSNHWLNCILLKDEQTRDSLMSSLNKSGIESRKLWFPMHRQPVFTDTLYFGENNAEELFNKGLALPSSTSMTEKDLEKICEVLLNFNFGNT